MDHARDIAARRASSSEAGGVDLLQFLDGRVRAWGVFEDRSGRLRRSFSVELEGRWSGARFTVDEVLRFDDGETERRTWHFVRDGGAAFSATGTGIVGRAVGRTGAGWARMRYRMRMRFRSRSVTLDLDDRYYPLDGGRLINRATVCKFGVRLGEVTILFEREPRAVAGTDQSTADREAA